MSVEGSNNDCYFYFYSSCTKGDNCPFRHCQAALGTETVCLAWREGRCFRSNCKFRHMESRINRSTISCYWENQPTGCCKPHCVFLHKKSRSVNSNPESKRLILPVSSNSVPSHCASKDGDAKEKARHSSASSMDNYSNHSGDVMSPHHVEPIVVNFDEESDSESVSSTPMKSASSELKNNTSSPAKRNLMKNLSENKEDFGIKSLEQIKMEKIHKESEHFYKSDDPTSTEIPNMPPGVNRNSSFGDKIFTYSAYDAPIIDSTLLPASTYKSASVSEFISVPERPMDKSPKRESSLLSSETERDLRSRLLKRKGAPSYKDGNTVQLKKVPVVHQFKEDDSLNFKVKTLDEIKKERERKSGTSQGKTCISYKGVSSTPDLSSTGNNSIRLNTAGRSLGRMKIRKQSNESLANSNAAQVPHASDSMKTETLSQMVLHEVQNISSDQAKTVTSKVVKRKESDNVPAGKRSKFLRSSTSSVVSSSNGCLPHTSTETLSSSINGDGQVKKLRRPIIRRNMSSEPASSVSESSTSTESLRKSSSTKPIIKRSLVTSPSTTSNLTTTSESSNMNSAVRPCIRRSLVSSPSVTSNPSTTPTLSSESDVTHPVIRSLVSPPSDTPKPTTTPESNDIKSDSRPIIRRNLVLHTLTRPKPVLTVSGNQKNGSVVSVVKVSPLSPESKKPLPVHKISPVKMDMALKIEDAFALGINDKSNKTLRSTSVDEFERFLNDTDLTLDDVDSTSVKNTEDLMLEIDQLLDS